jgi:predicted nucleic acid-binding protein
MTRYLLDTNSAGYFVNKRHGLFESVRAEIAKGHSIGIAIPVLAELAAGIEHSQSRDRNMKRLMTSLGILKTWPFDRNAAFE